jgi:hypothetical protein
MGGPTDNAIVYAETSKKLLEKYVYDNGKTQCAIKLAVRNF